jgi:hypothetical protein
MIISREITLGNVSLPHILSPLISGQDLDTLKRFLKNLMNLRSPSALRIPSRLASTLTNFSTAKPLKQKIEKPER